MSLSDTEKHELKPVRDVFFCIPPKKRHLLWRQSSLSMSPPATYFSVDNYRTDKDCGPQEPELHDAGAGVNTNVSESMFFNTSCNSATVKSSPGRDSQEGSLAVCVNRMDANANGKFKTQDASASVAQSCKLQSAWKTLDNLPTANKAGQELPNDKCKVHQAEEHETKPSKQALRSFVVESCSKRYVPGKKETSTDSNPCSEDAGAGEDCLNDTKSSKQASLPDLCSDRSNWDLNTMMDSWEDSDAGHIGDLSDEPQKVDVCNKGPEPCENLDSLMNGHFITESNVELKLTSTIENYAGVDAVSPNHSAMPCASGDTSHLNLSMTLTCTTSSPSVSRSENQKRSDQGIVDRMHVGKQNSKPVMLKNVKSEPSEVPVAKSANIVSPNSLTLVHNAAVKLETRIETPQSESDKVQEKEKSTECPCLSPEDPLKFKQILQENTTISQSLASAGECISMNILLPKVPSNGDTLHIDAPQTVGLNVNSESICKVKKELPGGNILVTTLDITENCCTSSSADVVNTSITSDAKHPNGTDCADVPSQRCEVAEKLLSDSENVSAVLIGNCGATAESLPHKPNITDQVSDIMTNKCKEVSKDGHVSLDTPYLLGDQCTDSVDNKMTGEGHDASQVSNEEPSFKSLASPQKLVCPSQVISRHIYDDDIEDGEVRDSQQAIAVNILGERENRSGEKDLFPPSVVPVLDTYATLNKCKNILDGENLQETQTTHVSNFSDSLYQESMLSSKVSEEQTPSCQILLPATEPSKKILVKSEIINHAIEDTEKVMFCSHSSGESHGHPLGDNVGEVDSYKTRIKSCLLLPSDSKANVRPISEGAMHILKKDDTNHITQSNSSSKDSPSEKGIASNRKSVSSRSERERSCDQLVKGDLPLRRGNRDEACSNGPRKVEKERKRDEAFRKVEPDHIPTRGRTERTLHIERNPDVVSERFNNVDSYQIPRHKNAPAMISVVSADCTIENAARVMRNLPENNLENFSRVAPRRRSPGGRDRPMGRMVRRREMSPGRCIDAAGPNLVMLHREDNFVRNLREDMVDTPNFAGPRSNFERGENSFIRRGIHRRSLSPPMQRRGMPRLPPHMCSPSSRRRPRSPGQWSPPQRPLDGFDGHPEAISCRSPAALRVDRIRSPRRHEMFTEDMVGRRPTSPPPFTNRLHDGMRDVGLQREYNNFGRNGRPFQRNVRNFHMIDAEVGDEVDFFGSSLHPGQLRELPEENVDDGRNCNERHELIRPFRRYNVPNNAGHEDFSSFRIERNPPPSRPMRFHAELTEELPERDDMRGGGIRHRVGEMPRRLRAVEDRGDVCQRDGGQGWPDSDFGDVRLKRRRY